METSQENCLWVRHTNCMKKTIEQPVKMLGRLLGNGNGSWAEIAVLVYKPRFHGTLETWYCRIHAPSLLEEDTFVMADDPPAAVAKAVRFARQLAPGLADISQLPDFKVFDADFPQGSLGYE